MSDSMIMRLARNAHDRRVFRHRVQVLVRHIDELLPPCRSLLDVGCGDGNIDTLVAQCRPDLTITGIDVFVRPQSYIPVTVFDGVQIPHASKSQDVVMFVDVLHHTDDPTILLAEAARVARKAVLIKDHTRDTRWAGARLRFMDMVGNPAHGVRLPYNYWSQRRWHEAWDSVGLRPSQYRTRLGLYPAWVRPLFEHRLHFVALLEPAGVPTP